jgi:RNA polymerase sigma-70 factor (ECF subfamily)
MSFVRTGRHMAMTMNPLETSDAIVRAVREGDEAAFTAVTARHRRELHLHAYRILGSFSDAEDIVQETFLRAWRRRESLQGRSTLRAWLYAIATNACLDFLDARGGRTLASEPGAAAPPHVPWLTPYPDRLMAAAAPRDEEPDAVVVSKETIELAYLVALQHLPPKQRAVLVLADGLEWSATEIGDLLELSVASVNSALQRARATLREHTRASRSAARPAVDADAGLRSLLDRLVDATQRSDVRAVAALMREDLRWSMPPHPVAIGGREAVLASWAEDGYGTPSFGDLRCVVTAANRMPALACYLRKPGESQYRALAIDVLRVEDGAVAEITTFSLDGALELFGLPEVL